MKFSAMALERHWKLLVENLTLREKLDVSRVGTFLSN